MSFLFVVVRNGVVRSSIVLNLVHLFDSRQRYVSFLETVPGADGTLFDRVRKAYVFCQELGVVSRIFLVLLGVHLVTCLPIYGVKFSEYGVDENHHTTHSFQYRWTLSIAYMKGNVPAVLLMLMWVSVIVTVVMFLVRDGPLRRFVVPPGAQLQQRQRQQAVSSVEEGGSGNFSTLHSSVTYGSIFLLNAVVTGSVNGLYIYLSTQALHPDEQLSIQVAVALFKVGWNMGVVPLLAKPMKTSADVVGIELILLVFNNILIPCLVAAFTSPACFKVNTPRIHL